MRAGWEIVVGLETHAQLSTVSKMFSGASTAFGAPPNQHACAIDVALPGVLPTPNRGAVERAIRFGIAVGGRINRSSVFARKHYFYPDLPKAYQISQYEQPIVQGGVIAIQTAAGEKTVRLTRAHLEEDAGKSLHEDFHGATGIDLNRAGTPLLEIVSEPDLRSADEAVAYAKALHALVRWIGICDGNMQEGSFRCDANVSVRRAGDAQLGTRCEIKNLNSFRFLEQAILHEAERQVELVTGGGRVIQETRLYDPDRGETRSMRSKEDAHDYRYFPDPDLPPLTVSERWIEEIAAAMPELPQAKRSRYQRLGLSAYDSATLTQSADMAAYFEEVLAALAAGPQDDAPAAKLAANWVTGELASALNRSDVEIRDSRVSGAALAGLLRRVRDGTISGKIGKDLFDSMWSAGARAAEAADELIEQRGLRQISDTGALEKVVDDVLAAHPAQVAEYRAGREKAFNYLVGQAMKATKGKGNPAAINELLKRKLA